MLLATGGEPETSNKKLALAVHELERQLMQGLFALLWGRYALQVLQGILEVVVNQCLRLRANSELVVDGADGGNFGLGIRPALATEVFHNFTLLHDDLMDQAPL
ncbi:MAG: polyprenyl synthetase family protein, partial [Bacteroidota bacterium]|nr:polyprenyl synthetase family protein [Bacteroidota bacterium]